MNGILIIAHAPLASALRQCVAHVFTDHPEGVAALDVQPNTPPEETLAQARTMLSQLGTSHALVLADVFGATPCNIARHLAERVGVRVVAGVNVPMLWRAINYRNKSLDDMVTLALAGASQGVMQVAVSRPQNQAIKPSPDDSINRHHQQ